MQAPRNGSTTHTVAFPAASAGNLLVVVAEGAVTSTTPAGFTLPAGGSAINNTGLYVWWKVAAGGEASFTTTHNASNYPVAFVVYEFPAGSSFVKSVAATGVSKTAANPSLTALTGTNLVVGAKASPRPSGWAYTETVWSGSPVPVRDVDVTEVASGTDGYAFSLAVVEALTGVSWQPTGTVDGEFSQHEALTFAVKVAAGGGDNIGTLTAVVPRLKGSIVGRSVNPGMLAAPAPKLRGGLSGQSVNRGSLAASLARVTGSITGAVSNRGTLDAQVGIVTASIGGVSVNSGVLNASVPKVTAVVIGQSVNRGTLNAVAPLVTGHIMDVVTNRGTLNGTLPRVTGVLVGVSASPGVLDTRTPVITGVLAGQATNRGVLTATLPLVRALLGDTTSNPGTLTGHLPKVTAGISGASVNRGSLNATAPTVTGAVVGELVNTGALTATAPLITGTVTGSLVTVGVLAVILPRLLMTKHVHTPVPDVRALVGSRITRELTLTSPERHLVGHAPTRSLKGAP